MNQPASTPAPLRWVALIVLAWAISEPLLLDAPGSRLTALALGVAVALPLLAAWRAPVLVATLVTTAYLVQKVSGERSEIAMSPELALAFGLFCVAAYAPAESRRGSIATLLGAAAPAGLALASILDLGVVRDPTAIGYLYLSAVVAAGVLPGLALRSRRGEVETLQAEVETLYGEAAEQVGRAVEGERRALGSALVRVVSGLVGEIESLATDARASLSGAPEQTQLLGRRMSAATGQAGDELRSLLGTLTAEPVQASTPLAPRPIDLRALAGLAFPVAGLAVLGVVDRMQLPQLPVTVGTIDGKTLFVGAPMVGPVIGYVLAVLTPMGLLWRRRYPVSAVGLVASLLVLRMAIGELSSLTITQVFTCGVLAYMAGAWPRTLPSALLAATTTVGAAVACWLLEQYRFDALPYAYMVGVMVGAWLVGRVTRHDLRDALALRDRTQVLRAQRDRLCELAVSGQRRDVAREMHDVVGHGLSLISVQAGVVDALAPRDPARALDALTVVEGAARSTRAELAALQAALSDPVQAGKATELADPAAGRWAAVLERIVGEAREVGQPVMAWIDPRLDELDPAVGGAVVRIVQEALTNVRKHAGGAATTLEATVRGGGVELSIANEHGGELADTPAGSGLGITGMADRAAKLGGTVDAGAVDGAGWSVRARIPAALPRRVSA